MNYLEEAAEEAKKGIQNQEGGPFGAAIVDEQGNIVALAHNEVLKSNDPTAHAEINAIRMACQKLQTKDLSKYTLYSTCEPCPMCLSAIIWANIKKVYYSSTRKDAREIDFKDDDIYEFLKGNNKILDEEQMENKSCKDLFINYNGERY